MQRDFYSLPYDVRIHPLLAIKIGLRTWAKRKMKINRAYTPKNMLTTATWMTGSKYKIGEYLRAADDIEKLCDRMKKDEMNKLSVSRTLSINDSFGQVM